jgi:hypothetical protein
MGVAMSKHADRWTGPHIVVATGCTVIAVAVAVLGFLDIYLTITHLLHQWWGDWAWTVIVLGEGAGVGAYLGWLLLEMRDNPPKRIRVFVACFLAAFAAASLGLNVLASKGSVADALSHVVVVGAFFGYLFYAKVLVERLSGTAHSRALEVAMADARQYAMDLCRDRKGRAWRWRVPVLLRRQILSGRLTDDVRQQVSLMVGARRTSGWEEKIREWVLGTEGLNLSARAEADARKAAQEIAASASPGEPESAPQAVPVARPQARSQTRSGPALKLSASRSRNMSPADLEPHVSAMLEKYGSVSEARIKRDLHVGAEKAAEALRLAKQNRTVVPMGQRAEAGSR